MKFVSTSIALAGMLLMAATGAQAQTPAPTPAQAQAQGSTFDKIQSSGKIVLGVRESSAPMAYAIGADRKYAGYHVELCEKVVARIAPKAKIEYMALARTTVAVAVTVERAAHFAADRLG